MACRRRLAIAVATVAMAALVAGCGQPIAGVPPDTAPRPSVAPTEAPSPSDTSAAAPTATPSPTPTKSAEPPKPAEPPEPAALLERGDRGDKVRQLQHRLRQLDWYSGTISGHYQASTVKGVRGFQDKRKLDPTGAVDQATWSKLVKMTRKPSRAEMYNKLVPGPALLKQGSTGGRVRELQARLRQIAWYSGNVTGSYGTVTAQSVRGFQGKRQIPVTGEVDQRTLDRLYAMTRKPTIDELHNRAPKPSAAGLDSRCMSGRTLCISKRTNSLVWVVNGSAKLRVDVRFGSYETPTREGVFSVGWKSREHVSTIYHTPMPYAMFFSGGQAVHYSPDFAARGYNGASHGCVNVRNLSAIQWLFDQVQTGDKVVVYR